MDPFKLDAIYGCAEHPRTEKIDQHMATCFSRTELQEAVGCLEAVVAALYPTGMLATFANVQEKCRYLRAIARLNEVIVFQSSEHNRLS